MKKIICFVLIFVLFTVTAVSVSAMEREASLTVNVDKDKIDFDVEPKIIDGRTMVPMRKIFEHLGAEITWRDFNKSIYAECGYLNIWMQIDNKEMKVGERTVTLDVAPVIDNGRTLVPLRAVAEAFSAEVEWDGYTKTVDITTKYPRFSYIAPKMDFDSKNIRTSHNDYEYIDFKIDGEKLKISGKTNDQRINSIGISFGKGQLVSTVPVSIGKEFSVIINLTKQNITDKIDVNIFTQKPGNESYWSYIYGVLFIEKNGNEYNFVKPMVLEHNKEFMASWKNPIGYINSKIEPEIVALSNEICKDATNDYEKILKIHDWVAENIYYDYDYLLGKSTVIVYDALGVYTSKRSVCEGYATLTQALIHVQGIPCRKISGYSLGFGSAYRYWTEETAGTTDSNHAWVQAYIDNRWINIDATWDSGNKVEDGEFKYKGMEGHMYFDITDVFFSFNHKYMNGQ